MGIAEICIVLIVLIVGLPILFRLLKALGPIIAILVAVAVAIGVVALAFNLIGSLIGLAADLLIGPLGLLLVGGGVAFFLYRRWQQRQLSPNGVVTLDEKRKRSGSSTRLEIGDDGEIVTLDELLDEDGEKKKRG